MEGFKGLVQLVHAFKDPDATLSAGIVCLPLYPVSTMVKDTWINEYNLTECTDKAIYIQLGKVK